MVCDFLAAGLIGVGWRFSGVAALTGCGGTLVL